MGLLEFRLELILWLGWTACPKCLEPARFPTCPRRFDHLHFSPELGQFAPISDDRAGIQEGSYRVTVSWPDPNHKTVERFGVEASDPKDLLKGKYITRDKSKLTVTITRSSKELEPFELTTS